MLKHLLSIFLIAAMNLPLYGQTSRQKASIKGAHRFDLLKKESLTIEDLDLYEEEQNFYYSKGPYYNIQLGLRFLQVADEPIHLQHIHSQMAGAYRDLGMYSKAIDHQLNCIRYAIELKDEVAEGYASIQLGNIYYDQEIWAQAAELYNKAIGLSKSSDFKHIESVALNNLGMIEEAQGHFTKALEYYFLSLAIRKNPSGSRDGISHGYSHIGQAYALMEQRDSALFYLNKSLVGYTSINSVYGTMLSYERLGRAYKLWVEYDSALIAYREGLHIARSEEVHMREADFLFSIAEIHELQGNHDRYIASLKEISDVAERINYQSILPKVYESLFNHYRERNDYKTALFYHEKLEQALNQVENRSAAVELAEAKLQLNDIIQQKELEYEKGRRERANLITVSVALLLLVTTTFGGIVFGKNRNLKKVNQLIESQKAEIEKQNEALERALAQAENSALAKSQFLSRMSHEIRTPMNAIVGLTDVVLQQSDMSDESRKNATAIAQSAEHLLSLINEVLEFSRMETKEYQLVNKTFNLHGLIQNIEQTTALRAASKGNEWIVEIDPKLHTWYKADAAKLNEVLVNLLGNAHKFCTDGKVTLKAECLRHDEQLDRIRFSISDTGIGIPEDRLQDIFKEFVQVSEEIHLEYGGTGLGLAISQRIVNAMGGQIEVQSILDKGSTFSFELDLERAKGATTSSTEIDPATLSGTVLLVEDDAMNQLVFKQLMSKTKCHLDIAANGKIGFQKASDRKFDIIFMDLQMPEMNGFESAHAIRRNPDSLNQRTPIIAFSADVFEERQKQARAVGMNEFLMKPARQTDLYSVLAQYLQVSVTS